MLHFMVYRAVVRCWDESGTVGCLVELSRWCGSVFGPVGSVPRFSGGSGCCDLEGTVAAVYRVKDRCESGFVSGVGLGESARTSGLVFESVGRSDPTLDGSANGSRGVGGCTDLPGVPVMVDRFCVLQMARGVSVQVWTGF